MANTLQKFTAAAATTAFMATSAVAGGTQFDQNGRPCDSNGNPIVTKPTPTPTPTPTPVANGGAGGAANAGANASSNSNASANSLSNSSSQSNANLNAHLSNTNSNNVAATGGSANATGGTSNATVGNVSASGGAGGNGTATATGGQGGNSTATAQSGSSNASTGASSSSSSAQGSAGNVTSTNISTTYKAAAYAPNVNAGNLASVYNAVPCVTTNEHTGVGISFGVVAATGGITTPGSLESKPDTNCMQIESTTQITVTAVQANAQVDAAKATAQGGVLQNNVEYGTCKQQVMAEIVASNGALTDADKALLIADCDAKAAKAAPAPVKHDYAPKHVVHAAARPAQDGCANGHWVSKLVKQCVPN